MYHADLIGSLVGRLCGYKKIIWCIRNSNIDKKFTPRSTKLTIKLCSLISNFIPRKIVYCSKKSSNVHEKIGYPISKTKIIYNGVDYNLFKPVNNVKKNIIKILNIPSEKKILGIIARWSPQKDLEFFISIMGELKNEKVNNWHLILAGKNLDKNNSKLVEILKKNKIIENTTLLGFKNNLVNIYNTIDIVGWGAILKD